MQFRSRVSTALALVAMSPISWACAVSWAYAQDLVFVGTSVAGGVDPHFFVDARAASVAFSDGSAASDNVSGAVWEPGGSGLFVASTLSRTLSRADLSSGAPEWSTVYTADALVHGVGLDAARGRLYTLVGETASSCELVAIYAESSGADSARELARTKELSGRSIERWALAPNGDFAVVPTMLLEGGWVRLVDTDPASATYLSVNTTSLVPGIASFAFCASIALSRDSQWAYFAFAGPTANGIARWHVPTRRWIDFDPTREGVQHLAVPKLLPAVVDVAPDDSYLLVCGRGAGGWVARIQLDAWDPAAYSLTELLPERALFDGAFGAQLAPDGVRAAITSGSPAKLVFLDVVRGELLGLAPLERGANAYTVEWRPAKER